MKKDEYQTAVVNFFGGPGSRKSTFAARLFADLKMREVPCELVTEFAKDVCWRENYELLKHQYVILAEQTHRMASLQSKVKVIVTDSPLLQQVPYIRTKMHEFYSYDVRQTVASMALAFDSCFDNINFLMVRPEHYDPIGRVESREQALKIDQETAYILDEFNIDYERVSVDSSDDYDLVLNTVLAHPTVCRS